MENGRREKQGFGSSRLLNKHFHTKYLTCILSVCANYVLAISHAVLI